MSFGFGSGFGQNNNTTSNQQSSGTGFGGFGSGNTGNTGGFGASNAGGFGGSTNTGGAGLFGTTSSGFGGFGSGAASTQPSAFSSTPASTGGGLFGGTASTTGNTPGFGGFGTSTTQNASPFGGGNTSGAGLFGAAKPAFGASNTAPLGGPSLFGGGNTTNAGGFGSTAPALPGAFGAGASTALGAGDVQCPGTGNTAFQAWTEKENGSSTTNHFQTISFMQPYMRFSLEELRLADYAQGRRYGNANNQAGAFGTSTGFGGFGNTSSGGSAFGSNNATTNTGGGLFGNTGNTSTGFGSTQASSTPFGGTTAGGGLFGAKPAGNSLFGGASNTTTPATQGGALFGGGNTSTAFGANNAGGSALFGNNNNNNAAKPGGFTFGGGASTGSGFGTTNNAGAFGATNTAASSGGGLFGNTTATASPFGGATQQQNNPNPFSLGQNQATNNSPFGNMNQNNQAKPAGGLFGNTATNAGGGLFGNTNNNQQQTQSTGLFGATNNANNNNSTGGIFGSKPFGQTTTTNPSGGGLFGNASNNTNNNAAGASSLFGGLGSNTQNQAQQNQGGGLFGGSAQQQQSKPGGLFGSLNTSTNATNNAGGGLFGNVSGNNNNPQQQAGGSLFGANNNQNQQPGGGGLGGSSLFGSTPQNLQQTQQQQGLSASIQDKDPYGSASLFSGLATPTPEKSGPIATPLSSTQKSKKNSLMPSYKTNPASASRLITPLKRGYGLSYSALGTPNSVSSSTASTPMGGSLLGGSLGGSLGRTLAKSQSTSSLRRNFDGADSVLSPNAFSSASNRRLGGSTSLKKLQINRNLRSDLFSPPTPSAGALPAPERNNDHTPARGSNLKKRVSFEAGTVGGNGNGNGHGESSGSINGSANIFSQAHGDGAAPTAEQLGFMRPSPSKNGPTNGLANGQPNGSTAVNGSVRETPKAPEMEQVKGKELAIVHEDGTPPQSRLPGSRAADVSPSHDDEQMGRYWVKPPMHELKRLSREQLKRVSGFVLGREGCGKIEFQAPVDLTGLDFDRFYDHVVLIKTRSATVYTSDTQKPPQGKGMNVPSIVQLLNSWPRANRGRVHIHEKSGPAVERHIKRLKSVKDTEFLSYDPDTGVWTFRVPHFTTYGLEYDDDDETELLNSSVLSAPPDTPTPKSKSAAAMLPLPPSQASNGSLPDTSMMSEGRSQESSSGLDDTFEFKTKKRLPGAFDGEQIYEDDTEMEGEMEHMNGTEPFLDERSVGPASDREMDEPEERPDIPVAEEVGSVQGEDREMAGSYPSLELTTELRGGVDSLRTLDTPTKEGPMTGLKSILRGGPNFERIEQETPSRRKLDLEGDWVEQLQRTASPRKRDRAALRESQGLVLRDNHDDLLDATPPAKRASVGRGINTSIDLMNSLFTQEQHLKWPYAKRSKQSGLDLSLMDPAERAYHESNKPNWASDGSLIYAVPSLSHTSSGRSDHTTGILVERRAPFVSEGKDVHFAKFATIRNPVPNTLALQKESTHFYLDDGVPTARVRADQFQFRQFPGTMDEKDPQGVHEKLVWELASVLFDDVNLEKEFPGENVPHEQGSYLESRVRKERLSNFWSRLVHDAASQQAQKAGSNEERAIAHLSAHQVEEACGALVEGRDFRLATLVAMIGGDQVMRDDMKDQMTEWRRLKVLSELSEPIRALYELLAGQTCVCEGNKGAPEDQARTFVLSDRFGLDWRQTFGLRLWYAILEEDPLENAVDKFRGDLDTKHEERARPLPWFQEQGVAALWNDPESEKREDLLWGLLKHFSNRSNKTNETSLREILMPHNHQVSPVDYRLAWQLFQTLSLRQAGHLAPDEVSARLTTDYAWQLEIGGYWRWTIYVVMHLRDGDERKLAIQALLARNAGSIGSGPEEENFKTLTREYLVPEKWIWEAKALYERSVTQDHMAEVDWLLRAGNWEEAHTTLCSVVAPRTIIEDDIPTLRHLLAGFKKTDLIPNWNLGGQVYLDYLRLLQLSEHEEGHHRTRSTGHATSQQPKGPQSPEKTLAQVIASLSSSLPAMLRSERKADFTERVAVREMSGVLGKVMLKKKDHDHSIDTSKILALPLTEDRYLRHTVDLSLAYYKAIMAGGGQ